MQASRFGALNKILRSFLAHTINRELPGLHLRLVAGVCDELNRAKNIRRSCLKSIGRGEDEKDQIIGEKKIGVVFAMRQMLYGYGFLRR